MSVVVIGKNGQLAYELAQTQPDAIEAYFFDSQTLDVRSQQQINDVLCQLKPSIVINASAYTAVDKAETDKEDAYAINAKGVEYVAQACKNIGARLIHISTDFVFAATQNTPYQTQDSTSPLGVYGASKLAGELAINTICPDNSVIIRTSWVYSSHGNNFVKTMLRLMAEKPELGIVSDQIGSPTWAKGLAKVCWDFAYNNQNGIYHYSDLGVASWYDFAVAIQELGVEKGLLKNNILIKPIKAASYPTPAKRPAYSVMDTEATYNVLGINGTHWRTALKNMMNELDI
jgi:dTDP-4-dehydrorhamnose reductase